MQLRMTLPCLDIIYVCSEGTLHACVERNIHTLFSYRWLKSWNITLASESKQRSLAKELTGGVAGEYALFSFIETKK